MIKNHPGYAWEIGRESHYFLLALEELKRMLQDGKINWIFHPQSNILRSNDVDKMLHFVSNGLFNMKGSVMSKASPYFKRAYKISHSPGL